MNVKKMLFFAALTAAVIVSGCSSNSSKKLIKKGLYNCNSRFETAMKRIEKKNYSDAIRILDEIKYQCGGSSLMDTVYYHTAMSHFRLKQYADARVEFENLQHEYPRSPFAEESYYRLGQMRYLKSNKYHRDQTETKEAVRLLSDYLDLYPNGVFADSARHFHILAREKLAEKEFRNAMFYRRQKEHNASLIYFNSLLAEYPQSKFTLEAAVGMVEALTAVGRVEDARETLDELEMADFSEPLQKRLEAVILKLNQPKNQAPQKAKFWHFFRAKQPAAEIVEKPVNLEFKTPAAEHIEPPVVEIIEVEPKPAGSEEEAQSELEKTDDEQAESQAEKTEVEKEESETEKAEEVKAETKTEAKTDTEAVEPKKTE